MGTCILRYHNRGASIGNIRQTVILVYRLIVQWRTVIVIVIVGTGLWILIHVCPTLSHRSETTEGMWSLPGHLGDLETMRSPASRSAGEV